MYSVLLLAVIRLRGLCWMLVGGPKRDKNKFRPTVIPK